jgi:hypothetical protein
MIVGDQNADFQRAPTLSPQSKSEANQYIAGFLLNSVCFEYKRRISAGNKVFAVFPGGVTALPPYGAISRDTIRLKVVAILAEGCQLWLAGCREPAIVLYVTT